MHRFFIDIEAISAQSVAIPAEQAHQIRKVLRMRPGQRIIVLTNDGWEHEVILERIERDDVSGAIVESRPVETEPAVRLTLFQSVLKRDKFEWVLQKCTEVGVSKFIPVVTNRSIFSSAGAISEGKRERWQKIITEAAEQSGRGQIPELMPAITFEEAVDTRDSGQLALLPWEEATETGVRAVLASRKSEALSLFIGPEGGFSQEEVSYAQGRGIIPVTLGRRILRAETASVVTAAMILYELGEMA